MTGVSVFGCRSFIIEFALLHYFKGHIIIFTLGMDLFSLIKNVDHKATHVPVYQYFTIT